MRYASFVSLSLLTLAAACHDTPSAPTPPTPVAARVELKADQVLLRAGQTLRLSDLVARVTDASGNAITGYTLTGTASGGCTLAGDTVRATNESLCRLRAQATYVPASASLAPVAPLFAAAGDSVGPDTAVVVATVDLKAHRWRAAWRCTYPGNREIMTDDGTFVDSIASTAVVDSVHYATDNGWIPNFGGVAQLWYTADVERFLRTGAVDTVHAVVGQQAVASQLPDTVVMDVPDKRQSNGKAAKMSAPGQLLKYIGGTWCSLGWWGTRGPVAFEEF